MRKVVLIFVVGIGPLCLLAGALWWWHYDTWMRDTLLSTGKVISTEVHWSQPTRQGEMREQQQAANVAWSDLDGGEHQLVVYARSTSAYKEGDRIVVRYLPGDPTGAQPNQGSVPMGPLIFGLMGLVWIGFAIKVLVIDKGAALPRAS